MRSYFKIKFPKFKFSNFYFIANGGERNYTQPIVKLLKKLSNYDVIQIAHAVFILNKNIYLCLHIAESANITESAKYRRL
jgi:hypothetical protein